MIGDRLMSDATERTCGYCGKKLHGRKREWCNESHRKKSAYAARRVLPEPRACRECGRTFWPNRKDDGFCLPLCRNRFYRLERTERLRREAFEEAVAADARRIAEREADDAARAARLATRRGE